MEIPTGVMAPDVTPGGVSNSVFTEDQIQVLFENGDINDAERQMLTQKRLAAELAKGVYRHKGRDVGSNLARAFSGIGAAAGQYKANKKGEEISGMYRKLMDDLYGPKGPGAPTARPNPMADPRMQAMAAARASQSAGPVPGQRPMPVPQGGNPVAQQEPLPPMAHPSVRPARQAPVTGQALPPVDPRAEMLRRMSGETPY